jgi:DNA-binding CsgD family transcriptional regulator
LPRAGRHRTSSGVDRIVGREAELESLERFVSGAHAWPSALVIEGTAGIGKSTLLDAVADAARNRSVGVLRCGPGDHESRLSFAALRDLLEHVYDEIATKLPAPQRRALAVALLREEPEAAVERGAVSAAFLTLLRERSKTGRVLVVVDDLQWLDRPTAAALAFATRRLRDEPVGFVFSFRSDGSGRVAFGLDRALSPERMQRITLGPLSLGALQAMFRARLGRSWPRPLLRRIHENSAGNPFFALEIARALERDSVSPGSPLPVPADLGELLRARIDVLPLVTRSALLAASASSQPTPDLVAAASGLNVGAHDALAAAERAGVIEIEAGQVRFTHPLLASAVYAGASTEKRRAVHRALAHLATDPEERARHLALSSQVPDASIAAALDDASRVARARGAPDSAAELAGLARTLTPSTDTAGIVRRGVEAAGHLFDAGDAIRAQKLFLEAAAATPRGPVRADILWRLADASWLEVDLVRGYLQEGLDDASGDLRLESGIRMDLAWTWVYGGDVAEATTEAQRSLEIALRLEDPAVTSEALAALGICEFLAGRDGADRIGRAVELQGTGSFPETYTSPRVTMGLRALWAGELDRARSILEVVLDRLAERGLYTLATEPHQYLSEIECRAGRYELAARHAATAIEIKLGAGYEELNALDLFPQALVDALRGDVTSAREYATQGLAWSERGDRLYANCNRAVLGFLELSLGRFAQAREHLDPVVRFLREMGVEEPCVIPVHADAIEAQIGMGDLDAAAELLAEFEEQGRTSGRSWALATAARCRALLLAAKGDAAAATLTFERALDEHGRVPQPLELARTLLAKGQVERRAKQKSAARQTLQQALETFEEIGAPLWAARARAELARIGGRAPAGNRLTATERRIADLVAEGMTNREVAEHLVVAERTVESALTQIYRKLYVRSRTERARKLTGTA